MDNDDGEDNDNDNDDNNNHWHAATHICPNVNQCFLFGFCCLFPALEDQPKYNVEKLYIGPLYSSGNGNQCSSSSYDDSMYFTGIVYCSLCLQRKPNESIYCAKRFAPQRISVSILLPVGIPSCLKETNL